MPATVDTPIVAQLETIEADMDLSVQPVCSKTISSNYFATPIFVPLVDQ